MRSIVKGISYLIVVILCFSGTAYAHPVTETDFDENPPAIFMDHIGYSPTDYDEIFVSPWVYVSYNELSYDVPLVDWQIADFQFGCIEPDGHLRVLFIQEDILLNQGDYFPIGFYGEREDMRGCDFQNDDPSEYAGFVKSLPHSAGVAGETVSSSEIGAESSIILIDTDLEIHQDSGTGGCDVTFSDVPCDFVFHEDVEWLAESGITKGCNPPDNTLFCPNDNVTRGQMAAFMQRGFGLEFTGYGDICTFVDVSSTHTFFEEVGVLCQYGITKGCNPPDNTYYCPEEYVTRGQMAAFMKRALDLPASSLDQFIDDEDSVFEADIQALAASGITRGCNPPANDRFCPNEPVTRGQMAAFLKRALSP